MASSGIGIRQDLLGTTRALVLQSLAGVGSFCDPSLIGFDGGISESYTNMAPAFPEIGGNLTIPWNGDAAGMASLGLHGVVNALPLLMTQPARVVGSSRGTNTTSREKLLTDLADRMREFPMSANLGNAGGGSVGGNAIAATPTGNQEIENLSDALRAASSMTPAGISHQDLYARDGTGDACDESDNCPRLLLYMKSCDDDNLSSYQCLVRKQIEIFEATAEDIASTAQGRNKPIVPRQVGIRCRHCSGIPPRHRTRGATYYPAKLNGLYQAAQNMATAHLGTHCQLIPDALRRDLTILKDRKSSAGGGKQYWADCVRMLGVVESDDILRLKKNGESSEVKREAVEDEEGMSTSEGAGNCESKRKDDDASFAESSK